MFYIFETLEEAEALNETLTTLLNCYQPEVETYTYSEVISCWDNSCFALKISDEAVVLEEVQALGMERVPLPPIFFQGQA